jgi:hypothetical protein
LEDLAKAKFNLALSTEREEQQEKSERRWLAARPDCLQLSLAFDFASA